MKSQWMNEGREHAVGRGGSNPRRDIKIAALLRCGWIWAAFIAATVLALAPAAAHAEQRVAWATGCILRR